MARSLRVKLCLFLFLLLIAHLGAPTVAHADEVQTAADSVEAQLTTAITAGPAPIPPLRATLRPPVRVDGVPVLLRAAPETPSVSTVQDLDAIEVGADEKWIQVDLSEQRVWAYEGRTPVKEFVVSTGLPGTPTVTGVFRMWVRTPSQTMYGGSRAAGNYYYLENVQWVQYFYEDYSFHGTYWHNNFGQPMSRGCVNMTNEDAKWLFDWAMPEWDGEQGWLHTTEEDATLVVVHE